LTRKTKITIKDIAKELGISASTVSRALKDHPDISQKTRDAVNKIALQNNYVPNALALSLRSQKSNVIGVIIPEVVHFFFSSVISGIEEACEELGYSVLVCQSSENYEREIRNVNTCVSSRVDGIMVSMSKNTYDYNHFQQVIDDGIPLVFFDRVCPGIKADRVIVDDYTGAYTVVDHLIKGGCRRVLHLGAPLHMLIARNRLNGYKDALTHNGIKFDEKLVVECDTREDALVIVPKLMASEPRPDGIFAVNDLTASGAMYALQHLGISVPDDVAICGFSDGLVAQVINPPLTTVEQHGFEMGKTAATLLINRIEDKAPEGNVTKMIKTTLVVRESTKPLLVNANV